MELVDKRFYTLQLAFIMSVGLYMLAGYATIHIAKVHFAYLPGDGATLVFGLIGPLIFALRKFGVRKIGEWLYGFAAYVLNLGVMGYLINTTGYFHSPYIFLWLIASFFVGILGKYLPVIYSAAILLFFVLIQPKSGSVEVSFFSIGFILASLGGAYLSYLFWRKHYLGYDQQVSQQISNVVSTSNNQSEVLVNVVSDGVVTCNQSKQIGLFNPAISKLTGWEQADAIGLDVSSVFQWVDDKGEPLGEDQNPFIKAFQTHREVRAMHKLLNKSGDTTYISVVVSPIVATKNKEMLGTVAILRDVSKERGAEAQRAEFISTASHEMRTPVAAIEGYLALALNDKVATIDDRARNYLTKAHASTQHLGQLFQDLLTSAKAEDGRLSSHPVVIEMGSYLERLAEDLKFSAEKKGLFTEFVLGSSNVIDASNTANRVKPLYYAHADPDRLREVITNLFDNAVKYTESGKVTLGLTGNDEVVQFYIRDTGPGIPADDVPHLFQKFYRVDNSATRTIGGTGLGLFICRKIIELYHGHIWTESEVGTGSTFFVNLPRLTTSRAQQLQAAEASNTALPEITLPTESVVQ